MPPIESQCKQTSPRAIFIPARLESTRLPRKMLLPINDNGEPTPLVCWTAQNALRCPASADVYIITDSKEILETVSFLFSRWESFPVRLLQTAPSPNGTSRSFDAIRQLAKQGIYYEHIAILQGDVPNIDPAVIPLVWSQSHRVTTLVTDFTPDDYDNPSQRELDNPNIVKAICGRQVCYQDVKPDVGTTDQVFYFTREFIPYAMKHIGIYGLNSLPLMRDIVNYSSPLGIYNFSQNHFLAEKEDLEQLNWIGRGIIMHASYIRREQAGTAIDTQLDYDNYLKLLAGVE